MLQEQAYLLGDRMWNLLDLIHALGAQVERNRDEFQELVQQDPRMQLRRKPPIPMKWFDTLVDFTIFSAKNPSLRFWQALRSWVPTNFILVSEKPTHDFAQHEQGWLDDTFYRKGK